MNYILCTEGFRHWGGLSRIHCILSSFFSRYKTCLKVLGYFFKWLFYLLPSNKEAYVSLHEADVKSQIEKHGYSMKWELYSYLALRPSFSSTPVWAMKIPNLKKANKINSAFPSLAKYSTFFAACVTNCRMNFSEFQMLC